MSLNSPPKPPQEKFPTIETPEYWRENRPFRFPRRYFELQFAFAKIIADRTGRPLAETVEAAPAVRNATHILDTVGHTLGTEEDITDENMLEKAWERSLERHAKLDSSPTPYHEDGKERFGCHYYSYNESEKTVWVHFFNAEFEEEWVDGKDVSKGPLDKEKMGRRMHELTDMFREIKARHPEALYVRGCSNLYNLPSYRRLYPDTYVVGDIDYNPKLWKQGTTIWGQFLGGHNKTEGEYGFKEELAAPFLEKAKTVPLDRLADALPYPPRTAEGNIQDFYAFYGIT